MSKSKIDEQKIIAFLDKYNHLRMPFGIEQDVPDDLSKLTLKDKVVREAVRSHQGMDSNYELFSEAIHHRPLNADGDVGPVTELMIELPRCGSPDYEAAEEAVAGGNWKRCHGVGDFHSASIKVNNSPPSFLSPLFDEVKRRVSDAYAEVGLLLHWDGRGPVNINFHFVDNSNGWIGLAQVVNNATCSTSPIWCKYLTKYAGGSNDAARTQQWTTLIKHELGHNCGMNHTSGGVLNPSIIPGLPISWRGDPAWNALVARFGGQRVPQGPLEREMVLAWLYSDGTYEKIMSVPNQGGWA